MEQPDQPSMFVAPLHITKGSTWITSRDSQTSPVPSTLSQIVHITGHSSGQITPPLTPHDPNQVILSYRVDDYGRADFHTYLRAFYPYNPPQEENSSTVTLQLKSGDIILVHSIHTNGWADGTLLLDGRRGWLPTNYCEPYEGEPIRVLLNALTSFWDLVRGSANGDLEVFGRQDYVRGLVAGVRFLLVISSKTPIRDRKWLGLYCVQLTILKGKNKVPDSRVVESSIAPWLTPKSTSASFGPVIIRQDGQAFRRRGK